LGLVVVACGGATSGAGESGATGPATGATGAGGPCTMAGTYLQHFDLEPGGTNCPSLFDETLTIGPKAVATGTHDLQDGGSDCSWNVDASECLLTSQCTVTLDGFVTTASGSIAFVGDQGSGKENVKIADSAGDVLSDCTYDITMTKK
jgi:hypothetical protein